MIESRLKQIATGIAAAHGASATIDYQRRYPPTINTAEESELAAAAAAQVVGAENVLRNLNPSMGAEDFAWMLREKPGAYVWVGTGAGEGSRSEVRRGGKEWVSKGGSRWSPQP